MIRHEVSNMTYVTDGSSQMWTGYPYTDVPGTFRPGGGTWVGDVPPFNTPSIPDFQPRIGTSEGWGPPKDYTIKFVQAKEEDLEKSIEARPRNIYTSPDGNYHVDVVVAGYARDQVEVESEGQTVTVILHRNRQSEFISEDVIDDNDYEVQQIVIDDEKVEFEIPDKYVVDKLTAKRYDDGILRMEFKRKGAKKHGVA